MPWVADGRVVVILFDDVVAKVIVFRDIDMSMVEDNFIFKVLVFKFLDKGARAIA